MARSQWHTKKREGRLPSVVEVMQSTEHGSDDIKGDCLLDRTEGAGKLEEIFTESRHHDVEPRFVLENV